MAPPSILTDVRLARPEDESVVKSPVEGVLAPMVAPSIVPPLISAVAAVRLVLAVSVVNVPAAAVVVPPIAVLSIAPEFRSIEVIVVVPVADKFAKVASPVTPNVPVAALPPSDRCARNT